MNQKVISDSRLMCFILAMLFFSILFVVNCVFFYAPSALSGHHNFPLVFSCGEEAIDSQGVSPGKVGRCVSPEKITFITVPECVIQDDLFPPPVILKIERGCTVSCSWWFLFHYFFSQKRPSMVASRQRRSAYRSRERVRCASNHFMSALEVLQQHTGAISQSSGQRALNRLAPLRITQPPPLQRYLTCTTCSLHD